MSQIRDQMISRLAASTYTSFSSDFSCTDPAPKFPDGQEKVLEGDVHVKKKKVLLCLNFICQAGWIEP